MSRKKKFFLKSFKFPRKLTLATIMNITNRHLEKRNERKKKQKKMTCVLIKSQFSILKKKKMVVNSANL